MSARKPHQDFAGYVAELRNKYSGGHTVISDCKRGDCTQGHQQYATGERGRMTGEEIGRDKKAHKIARELLARSIEVISTDAGAFADCVRRAGFEDASEQTRKRVIEVLEGIAL